MKHTRAPNAEGLDPNDRCREECRYWQVVCIGSEEDTQLLAPSTGLLGFDFGFLTSDNRMIQKMQHLVAREASERKPQQQRDGFPHRAFADRNRG